MVVVVVAHEILTDPENKRLPGYETNGSLDPKKSLHYVKLLTASVDPIHLSHSPSHAHKSGQFSPHNPPEPFGTLVHLRRGARH